MPTQINGLPAHILLIHIVVVFVPLAALLVVVHAVWPAARRRLGVVTPAVALVALVFVPITTHAGTWLRDHLHASGPVAARIDKHARLGETLLPLVIILFVVAAALWYAGRRYEYGLIPDRAAAKDEPTRDIGRNGPGGTTATAVRTQPRTSTKTTLPTWASVGLAVVAVAVALINTVQLIRIGDAGSQAVWNGVVSSGS